MEIWRFTSGCLNLPLSKNSIMLKNNEKFGVLGDEQESVLGYRKLRANLSRFSMTTPRNGKPLKDFSRSFFAMDQDDI